MRTTLMSFIFTFLSLLSFAQAPVVFTEPHFSGQSQTLRVGDYRTADLRVGDKTISSIRLPEGFKAIVFDKDNFEGSFFEITISIASLDFWSGRISSIRIIDLNNPNASTNVGNTTNNSNPVTTQTNNTTPNTIPSTPSIQYGANDIVIFSDKNFTGEGQILMENGRYDDTQISIGNDRVRSVKVPQGYTVRMFAEGGFDGRFVDLARDVTDLATMRWDGQVSSIQVYRGNAPSMQNTGNAVILYLGSKFKWRNQSLGVGNYTSKDFGLAYDLTAIRVSQGFYVRLFDGDNFQGNSIDISNDVSDLDDMGWNDKTVSLQVISGLSPAQLQQQQNNLNNTNWNTGNVNNFNTANQVIIYQNWNYGGRMQALPEGNYPSMANLSVRSYDVSSIRIPIGYIVRLYSRENGQGSFVDLTQDVENLNSIGWDNRTMSLQILRNPNNSFAGGSTNNWNNNSGLPNSNNAGFYSNLNRSFRMTQNRVDYRVRIVNNNNASQIQTQSGTDRWTNVQVISLDHQRGYYRIRDNSGNEYDINLQNNGNSLILSNRNNSWTYFAE